MGNVLICRIDNGQLVQFWAVHAKHEKKFNISSRFRTKSLQLEQLNGKRQLHWHLMQHIHHTQLPKFAVLPLQWPRGEDHANPQGCQRLSTLRYKTNTKINMMESFNQIIQTNPSSKFRSKFVMDVMLDKSHSICWFHLYRSPPNANHSIEMSLTYPISIAVSSDWGWGGAI